VPKRANKLDAFRDQLDAWFGDERVTYTAAIERLRAQGCRSSHSALSTWWTRRQQEQREESILDRITVGARVTEQVEAQFARHPAPGLDVLIKLLRTIILDLSVKGVGEPALLKVANELMQTVLKARDQEHKAQALGLDREKFDWMRQRAELADRAEQVTASTATPAEKEAQMRAIFGLS